MSDDLKKLIAGLGLPKRETGALSEGADLLPGDEAAEIAETMGSALASIREIAEAHRARVAAKAAAEADGRAGSSFMVTALARKLDKSPEEVRHILEQTTGIIKAELRAGREVEFDGLGTFTPPLPAEASNADGEVGFEGAAALKLHADG